jgi:hypothetical protein
MMKKEEGRRKKEEGRKKKERRKKKKTIGIPGWLAGTASATAA